MFKRNPHLSFVLSLQKDGLSENTIKAAIFSDQFFKLVATKLQVCY